MDDATSDSARTGGLGVELAGEAVYLLPRRALWWPATRTLFVADVHLGKAETFRTLGVPVPAGPTEATLARLGALVDELAVDRLVVLGDLLHARPAQAPATMAALLGWRRARSALHCVLVRGNHDDRAGDPPAELGVQVVAEGEPLGPFLLCHVPVEAARPAGAARDAARVGSAAGAGVGAAAAAGAAAGASPTPRYALAGHEHPAVRLGGRGDSIRVPCFRVGRLGAVLPAFGEFTGAATVSLAGPDRLYAIAGERVFALPRASARGGAWAPPRARWRAR
jgi:DNA ligase-associated metallophosphoesterase